MAADGCDPSDMEANTRNAAQRRRVHPRAEDGDWLKQPLPELHKDFYLKHPDPSLQCEQFCWGNLEAAHPVIGKRSAQEADEYRRAHGIIVQTVRGRPAPKPFQTFQETSFPDFVEEVAMELFSTEAAGALPFAVQAQAWPCALSGADLIAIAPTGSGKTLAFLLPALVHIMAQPPLLAGEGPIALILEPTRELAMQTHSVAQQFCSRTRGEDRLRAGVVFGGIAAEMQTPAEREPDFGCWPEVLVATPGRLFELISMKRWISAKRISYVVLDEADHLLSPGTWLIQIKELLKWIRPDRQLLLFSATWPHDAERAASDLCGEELVRIRVNPAVPSIPQEVKLFPDSFDGGYENKLAELLRWIEQDLQAEESLLVFCSNPRVASEIAKHPKVKRVVGDSVAVLDHHEPNEPSKYRSFIQGRIRMLVSTFQLAGRGLDFQDTTVTLSLAIVLFDFPSSIGDYANCIGRTARPGQKGGRVYAFLPEGRFWIAGELIALLEHCGQKVPKALTEQNDQDQKYLSEMQASMLQLQNDKDNFKPPQLCGGEFNAETKVWKLPSKTPSYRRKLVHLLADELGVPHVSYGDGPSRRLYLSHERSALPDKYFIEGEEVVILGRERPKLFGTVADPHIIRRSRGILVYLSDTKYGEYPVDVPVDNVWPAGTEPADDAQRPYTEHNSHHRQPWKGSGGKGYRGY
ncbi:unnamed protein product [Effrenium voratum]|uniref:RNA helicase n=1 Tax=Effrenium voratum TaxID=2562239 RepID=A0AA36MRL7_9DINO|nr:unnamed protein product [Effrenium voratum]CAJ1381437.1 unnamed protein product [Effrenium voratum]